MRQHITAFGYGNRDIGPAAEHDRFWLDGAIAISPVEQIEFLRALHERTLPISERSTALVETALVSDRRAGATLRAKTGTGMQAKGRAVGWYVGYVTRGDETHYFALQVSGPDFASVSRSARIERSLRLLEERGVWPAGPSKPD